jgi:hypothetical protein
MIMEFAPKYLKDENGQYISPVMSAATVFLPGGGSLEAAVDSGAGFPTTAFVTTAEELRDACANAPPNSIIKIVGHITVETYEAFEVNSRNVVIDGYGASMATNGQIYDISFNSYGGLGTLMGLAFDVPGGAVNVFFSEECTRVIQL